MSLKALVVDDSAFMRKVISDILNSDPDIEVIATARDGQDAIDKAVKLNPDVITMDVEMPRVDGISALAYLMRKHPTPVVMVSAVTQEGADKTLTALEYGAVDFVAKPSGSISLDIDLIRDEIIKKIKSASKVKMKRISITQPKKEIIKKRFKSQTNQTVVIIGSSTGGPPALLEILPRIPPNFPAWILIVQHMPKGFTKSLAERLDERCAINVKEAESGDRFEPGTALIAPGDYHMKIKDSCVKLDKNPRLHGVRPSVDPTMISATKNFYNNIVGIILTGMGDDGAEGMETIKENGGRTIAQDEDSCVIFGMPKMAIAKGCVDQVVPLKRIPYAMVNAVGNLT
ncbi:MAG: chemotaxis response regulator protein-glutamate methylesterase [Candidatus Hydrothermarchaeales archaeon]